MLVSVHRSNRQSVVNEHDPVAQVRGMVDAERCMLRPTTFEFVCYYSKNQG